MSRLLFALAALLTLSCALPPDRDAVLRAYVDAVNRNDVEGALAFHTPDAVFLIPGQDTIAGLDEMRRLLQWDSVLQSSLAFGASELRGDTLVVDGGSERSLWFAGIGVDSILYGPGIRFVFDGALIAGIFPSSLVEISASDFEDKFGSFMRWGIENAPDQLSALMPGGRFQYNGDDAAEWLQLLESYRAASDSLPD